MNDEISLPLGYGVYIYSNADIPCLFARDLGSTFAPSFSSSDFPALVATPVDPSPRFRDGLLTAEGTNTRQVTDTQEKTDRKATKKAVDRTAERQKFIHERTVPKGGERLKPTQLKMTGKEKAASSSNGQVKIAKEQVETDRTTKDIAAAPNAVSDRLIQPQKNQPTRTEKQKSLQGKKPPSKQSDDKLVEIPLNTAKSSVRQPSIPQPASFSEPATQVPLLSKKPKKTKPTAKPVKVSKEDMPYPSEVSIAPAVSTSDASLLPTDSSSNNSRSHSLDRNTPTSVEELLEDLDMFNPSMDLPNHPFFDIQKINPASTMPLEYGPLVHALSALSVGGGSFANNMPSGSIDNAVSSFQQLLETLTQTISDLLRLLPRTTWDDSSSFDGVLRDMLKGDDFLDDAVDEGHGKEDEVAALTLALERRARWMEVQLSKLEELHRDINTAAVRAVLSFNDNGWDRHAFLPRVGNTLRHFDSINVIEEGGVVRSLTADELEQKLAVAKEAAVFAEAEVREVMERIQSIKPNDST
jgi:CCR4-NOT transcription complex subunit 4